MGVQRVSTIIPVNDIDLVLAVNELKHLIKYEAAVYMDFGYSYYHAPKADMPVNYGELVDFMGTSKLVPVNELYTTDKILGGYQDKFEFWTTVLHIKNKAKYSLAGRKRVAKIMLRQGEAANLSNLAYKMLEALTIGIAKYKFLHDSDHGEMEREDRFVKLCITNGIEFALQFRT